MTPYTEEDYAFTLGIKEKLKAAGLTTDTYLCEGNPENTGFINPLTGQYEIGAFHAKRKEIITEQVTQQLQYYVMQHNQYAGAYGITYQFVLPEVVDTDWNNALKDITVMAFVQGIPILGQQYYNNYGIAGSNIVNKEFFIGYNDGMTPIYYSSRILDKTNAEFVKRLSSVEIFDYSKEAAQKGYYPDTQRNPGVLNRLIEDNVVIKVSDKYSGPNKIEITIDGGTRGGTYIDKVKFMAPEEGRAAFYNPDNEDKIYEVSPDKIVYDTANNKIIITIDKIPGESSYGILIRDVDGRTKYMTDGTSGGTPITPVLPGPVITSLTYVSSSNNFEISMKNLKDEDGNVNVTLEYTYTNLSGSTSKATYTQAYLGNLDVVTGKSIPQQGYLGTHTFKITRIKDGKSDTRTSSIDNNLSVTSASYTQSKNTVKVEVSGLAGYKGTVNWIAKAGDGTTTLGSGTATITAGMDYCEFSPPASCIPGNFTFTVTDGYRTSSAFNDDDCVFKPMLKICMFKKPNSDRIIKIESTDMADPVKDNISLQKQRRDGNNVNASKKDYNYSSGITQFNVDYVAGTEVIVRDDRGYLITYMTVNGFDLKYSYRMVHTLNDPYNTNYNSKDVNSET